MKADSGRRNPAMTSNKEVLPAPDGPKIVVTLLFTSRSSSSVIEVNSSLMLLKINMISDLSPPHQRRAGPNRGECQRGGDRQKNKGMFVVAELNGLENCQG